MDWQIRIDLHLHSDCSDGACSPAMIAERLAAAGVTHAALTDHNSISSLEPFRQAFHQHGGAAISGLEVFASYAGRQIHLLAYGFDPAHAALRKLLGAVMPLENAIEAIHQAEGLAVLAHPLQFWDNRDDLSQALAEMKRMGLDGIEALYKPYDEDSQQTLVDLADEHALLVSAGSDFHGHVIDGNIEPGVEMDMGRWKHFRNSLSAFRTPDGAVPLRPTVESRGGIPPINWRWLVLRIIMPAVVTVALFVGMIFGLILPAFEQNLLDFKRQTIRELTASAWSILDEYEQEVQQGKLTPEEARRLAAERLRHMRYGSQGKDYFWIIDTHPRMIMHPYREDLVGQDLTDFTDPRGEQIFVQMVEVARQNGQHYVDYLWQWKDDPQHVAPKESYVRLFEPWGWIIGTGLYTEDVRQEIAAHERRLVDLSVIIGIIISLLLLSIVLQSARLEQKRMQAVMQLRESHEKYRALAEAATEGSLMIIGRRCAYANQAMLQLIGYTAEELPLLDVHDLFPPDGDDPHPTAARFDSLAQRDQAGEDFEGRLRRKDGSCIDVLLSVSRVRVGGRQALVVVARDLRFHKEMEARVGEGLGQYRAIARRISLGVLRAAADPAWHVVEANPAACLMLAIDEPQHGPAVQLDDCFADLRQRDQFYHRLLAEDAVTDMPLEIRTGEEQVVELLFSARLARGPDGSPRFFDAIVRRAPTAMDNATDDTSAAGSATAGERDDTHELLEQLETALGFLNEPAITSTQPLIACPADTSVEQAARMLSRRRDAALAVSGPDGRTSGIVTQHDLTSQVLGEGLPATSAVQEIMSLPVATLPENALAYEALVLAQRGSEQAIVVQDAGGRPLGLVQPDRLSRFRYYAPVILSGERRQAVAVSDVAQQHARLPWVAKAMIDLGARPRSVARSVSAGFDTVSTKLIDKALQDFGPPPVPFAFLAFGSIGRQEQTLVADQDNAIIYQDPPPERAEDVARYFLLLGRRVCDDLRLAGYPFCSGDVMASSPERNLSLSGWKEAFSRWIRLPDPRQLIEFTICFDFRCVYGHAPMAEELQAHVRHELAAEPAFFFHLARNCLQYAVPIGLFGNILTKAGDEDGPETLDVKKAMMLVVNFARLYGLRLGAPATNTIARLQALGQAEVIKPDTADELIEAYEFLMLLRFRHQVAALVDGHQADNLLAPSELTDTELAALRKAFSTIAVVQKKIGFDFPGAA